MPESNVVTGPDEPIASAPASTPDAGQHGPAPETAPKTTPSPPPVAEPAREVTPEAEPPPRKTLRQMLAEDSQLNAEFQRYQASQLKREVARMRRQELAAEAVTVSEDPDQSMAFAKKVQPVLLESADEFADTESPLARANANTAALSQDGSLAWVRQTPAYRELYEHHRGALNTALGELDEQDLEAWIQEQGFKRALDRATAERDKTSSNARAEALATERTAEALRNTPVGLNGSAGVGIADDDEFLRRHAAGESDDHARAMRLTGVRL